MPARTVVELEAQRVQWHQLTNDEKTAVQAAGYNRTTWTARVAPVSNTTTGNQAPPPTAGSKFEFLGKLAQDRIPKTETTVGDLEDMADVLKSIRTGTITTGAAMEQHMSTVLNMLALEDTLRVDISQTLGMSNEQLIDTPLLYI